MTPAGPHSNFARNKGLRIGPLIPQQRRAPCRPSLLCAALRHSPTRLTVSFHQPQGLHKRDTKPADNPLLPAPPPLFAGRVHMPVARPPPPSTNTPGTRLFQSSPSHRREMHDVLLPAWPQRSSSPVTNSKQRHSCLQRAAGQNPVCAWSFSSQDKPHCR